MISSHKASAAAGCTDDHDGALHVPIKSCASHLGLIIGRGVEVWNQTQLIEYDFN